MNISNGCDMLFGDDDLDDARAPSPWDGFMSTPPSETGSLEAHQLTKHGIPKLAPEVEEVCKSALWISTSN